MRSKLSKLGQTLRRFSQQSGGWFKSIDTQAAQLPLIEKLYKKNGLELKLSGCACPELYEVFKDGEQVAYCRLRWGVFRIDYPKVHGETIYETEEPIGDGIFEDNERLIFLTKAMRKILEKIKNN